MGNKDDFRGYKNLMRRLRPRIWTEVIGQSAVTQSLVNMLTKQRVPQTLLMEGDRGLGKTTCARLIAARLNCRKSKSANPNPCGKCASCRGVLSGREEMLVQEIDCGTRGGADDIREIISQTEYGSGDRFRVYILDEFHLTSKVGQAALLKSTEEPNSNVIWVLCTTEGHKVSATIRSRCTALKFRPLSDSAMEAYIQGVLDGLIEREDVEWSEYDEEAIVGIVELADGSVRQGLAIIEQMVAYGGNTLTATSVRTVSGRATADSIKRLIKFIVTGNIKQADINIRELYNDTFTGDLLAYLYREFIPEQKSVDDRRMTARLIRAIHGFQSAYSTSVNRSGLLFAMYDAVHDVVCDAGISQLHGIKTTSNLKQGQEDKSPMESKEDSRRNKVIKFVKLVKKVGKVKVVKEWDDKRIVIELGKSDRTLVVVRSDKVKVKAKFRLLYADMKVILKSGSFDHKQLYEDGIITKTK